jgi:hypothetical protein
MGTQEVQLKGILPWLVRWARRAGTRDFCPALVAEVGAVQNINFLTVHCFSSLVPIAQEAGHLSLNVSLVINTPIITIVESTAREMVSIAINVRTRRTKRSQTCFELKTNKIKMYD